MSSQLDDTRQGVQLTRGRCMAHARAMLHVRSVVHGPLVESSVQFERSSRRRLEWPHSAMRRQKCVDRNASTEAPAVTLLRKCCNALYISGCFRSFVRALAAAAIRARLRPLFACLEACKKPNALTRRVFLTAPLAFQLHTRSHFLLAPRAFLHAWRSAKKPNALTRRVFLTPPLAFQLHTCSHFPCTARFCMPEGLQKARPTDARRIFLTPPFAFSLHARPLFLACLEGSESPSCQVMAT